MELVFRYSTTTLNLYNSHLKAWSADYPLHDSFYAVHGDKQNRFVWDVRCMTSVRLPWNMTFQATGRYNSRRITALSPIPSANPTVVSIIATTTSTPVATEKSIIIKLGKG